MFSLECTVLGLVGRLAGVEGSGFQAQGRFSQLCVPYFSLGPKLQILNLTSPFRADRLCWGAVFLECEPYVQRLPKQSPRCKV